MSRLKKIVGSLLRPMMLSLLILAASGSINAQLPDIEITVDNVNAAPGDQLVEVPVYINNYSDTVVAFELWFQLDRPDLGTFDTDSTTVYDTTYWQCTNGTPPNCLDSASVGAGDPWDFIHVDTIEISSGGISIVGGLIENWETVISRSLSGIGYDVKVVAFADLAPLGDGGPTILPGQNGRLFSLLFNCNNIPDTLSDRVANIFIQTFPDNFSLSDPQGNSIGLTCTEVTDTSYYRCDAWASDVCLSWSQVSTPPYDSIYVYNHTVCAIDTNKVILNNGSIELCGPIVAGDIDGNGFFDISELAVLTHFAVTGEGILSYPTNGDVNGDCRINWEDVQLLVDGGPFTSCGCPNPVWECCMGMRGNVDYDVNNGQDDIDISDLTFLVGFMFKQGDAPMCPEEANVDGDLAKSIDIADLTTLANYMFKGGAPPANCVQ